MKLQKPENISNFVYWTPRIASILFVIFLMMFSLDVFEPGLSTKEIVIGLFMHSIPALVLLVVAIISWKYEMVGGIAFILAGVLYIISLAMNNFEWYMISWSLIIAGPAFLIGILYILNWKKRNKN